MSRTPASLRSTTIPHWFKGVPNGRSGLRVSGGGVHLSKTMMLPELSLLLDAISESGLITAPPLDLRSAIERLVLNENIFGKRTTNARGTTLKKVAELYGLYEMPIVTRSLLMLWSRQDTAKPQLALLCALARDPLLRASAGVIGTTPPGENVSTEQLRQQLLWSFPDRFTVSTLSALASRCAATWTQSRHLGRLPSRERKRLRADPVAVAYAIQIAKLAGFTGEAALASSWLQVLDLDINGATHMARRAEAEGLLRMRSAGHVQDVELRGVLAQSMGAMGVSHSFDELAEAYEKQVALPWRAELSSAERVWVLWYDKSLERRVTAQLGVFENATQAAGHGWHQFSVAHLYGKWVGGHRLLKGLLRRPSEIQSVLPEFEAEAVSVAKNAAGALGPNDVFAITGAGALFGVASVSRLIEGIAPAVSGRLLVFFPGRYEGGRYRLLDARDGWNYHAIPIPAQPYL